MNDLQVDVASWANRTFPRSNDVGKLSHLTDEVEELWQAVLQEQPLANIAEEAADILLILLHFADSQGFLLETAARKKLAINKARVWAEPDDRGVIHHIEGAP